MNKKPQEVLGALRSAEVCLEEAYKRASRAERLIKDIVNEDVDELYQASCLVPTGPLWSSWQFIAKLADKLERGLYDTNQAP